MPTANSLLDQAIALGKQENKALQENDIALAEQLAGRRSELIKTAWEQRHDTDPKVYKAKLMQLQSMQNFLQNVVKEQKNTSGQKLTRARKENKRMNGYKKAMNYTT